jgi:hypothetical protein
MYGLVSVLMQVAELLACCIEWHETVWKNTGKFGNCSVADDWKAVVEICSIEYWKRAVRNFL